MSIQGRPPQDADTIDAEHRIQIGLLDALEQAVAAGEKADEVGEILDRFRDYTRLHFLSEELLMRRHAFPHQADHVQEHARLSEDLAAIEQACRDEESAALAEAVRGYRARLLTHIRTLDDAFERFVGRS